MKITYKVLKKHAKGCLGIQPQNLRHGGPWCAIPAKLKFKSGYETVGYMAGSKRTPLARGHLGWVVFICNSTTCDGQLAVLMKPILEAAPIGGKRRS